MRAALARLPRSDRTSRGFTLVEVIVALTVLAIVSVALSALLLRSITVTASAQNRTIATGISRQDIDITRGQMPNPVLGTTTRTVTQENTTYTITRNVSWVYPSTTSTVCDGASAVSGARAYLFVNVDVTWSGMGTTRPVNAQTILWPGIVYGSGQAIGYVRVVNASGVPQSGIVVTMGNGASQYQRTTDTSGCAIFNGIPEGTYSTFLSAPNYADPSGNTTPSRGLTLDSTKAPAGWVAVYTKTS